MGQESKIQWTGNTWNPWHGCRKVSSGCKYCYMFRDKEKYGQNPERVQRSKTKFNEPLKWKEPTLVFTCSWSDWFIEEADAWRDEAWAIIKATPHLTYQILTKRPERIKDHLPADWGDGYPNVWLGVSVENQKAAEVRIPLLIEMPCKVRFLSCEPLLSEIDLDVMIVFIDWVIVGGESGNDQGKYIYRECKLNWIESLVDQCTLAEVPVFVKQLGTWLSKEFSIEDRHGGDIDKFPDKLQIRQFPEYDSKSSTDLSLT